MQNQADRDSLQKHSKQIIMISIDALTSTDAIFLQGLPHFQKLFKQGSWVKKVFSVLPTLTYPCHASLITGTNPKSHHIIDNRIFDPSSGSKKWCFFDRAIAVPTLYSVAKKYNKTTGAIFWPVTAGAKIDYNCPPIWPTNGWESQTLLSLRYGSMGTLIKLNKLFGKMRRGREYPYLDDFATASTCHIIKEKQPDLFLLSLTELDYWRHKFGKNSPQAIESLRRMDDRLGQIMETVQKTGAYEDVYYVIIGDHGFGDFHTNVDFNRIFSDRGWVKQEQSGRVKQWQVLSHSGGGSVQIYLRENDGLLLKKVSSLLQELKNQDKFGIADVFTKTEAQQRGLDGAFSFIVTARAGYHFSSDFTPEAVMSSADYNQAQSYKQVATHGFDPYLPGLQTMAILAGPGIKDGNIIQEANIIDIAPTVAHIMGWSMPSVEGRILDEALK